MIVLVGSSLFGCYENFPETTHGTARFSSSILTVKLQESILYALRNLSIKKIQEDHISPHVPSNSEVFLEFGIAENAEFNYLDEEMLNSSCRRILEQSCSILDFICIIRYYKVESSKSIPLRFDYHMIRFAFEQENVEIRVFHQKGTRRIPMENLMLIMVDEINKELMRRRIDPILLGNIYAL